ncbi:3-phosphoshikimate 1-carboxyvinyltransferase [uncultured Oscillibacter sp.]|uniref:3-phosphoshikimate 1-carboxyvinyltransferase n=1 Tax=uncultured Oscillibacter sp. TaxID=876091 RepID=UPI002803CEB3|nr:3-phosphoshikimate 1-carboxyvinyltransferase [uncultured Oscillibacter sp.]
MDIQITPRHLSGTVTPPPSKSMAHRLLIAAALGSGISTVRGVAMSQDVEATLRCLTALGGRWRETAPGTLEITGIGGRRSTPGTALPHLDCGESGSTLRFFLPIALAVAGGGVFTGQGRLMARPQGPYLDLFREKGIFCEQTDGTLTVRGTLEPGEYHLPGNVSSQFFTGLLFALPLLDGPSTIVPTTAVESWDYILMTLDALTGAGVTAAEPHTPGEAFRVCPAAYQPFDRTVEADWSQAAFWYAAIALGSQLELTGLNAFSVQGDMAVVPHFLRLTQPGDREIDVSGIPDLLPPLAVMAAVRSGTTRFVNAARLRMKESDRLETTAALLTTLGVSAQAGPDFLTVQGGAITGGTVDGANDHRIVMAAAIAATASSSPVTIRGAEAVKKSYPDFWEVYQSLGGVIHVL